MRAALFVLVAFLGLVPRAAAENETPSQEPPGEPTELTGPYDDEPEARDFVTPGRSNLSGEDPMFPARTSSREPPPPRRKSKSSSGSQADAPPETASELSRIEIEVQFAAVNRSLSFVHLSGSDLRGHEVSLAPSFGFSARVFPIPEHVPVFSGLGLHFEYSQSVGLESSRVDGGPAIGTRLSSGELGLRYRWDGRHLLPGLEFTPIAAFHRSSFILDSVGPASEADVPNLEYLGAKLGLEARLSLRGPVRIETEVAFLPVFSTGTELESARFFQDASGYGARVRARFGLQLSETWLLLVGAELLSYSLDLAPGPRNAAALSDRVLSVSIGVRALDLFRDD